MYKEQKNLNKNRILKQKMDQVTTAYMETQPMIQ